MNQYSLIASDLDGTLLSPEHTIRPYTRDTLKMLDKKGNHFVFATGRHHVDVGQIKKGLDLDAFMITSNGARVHDIDGNLIFSRNIKGDIARSLFKIADSDPNIYTNVYSDNEWFINRENPEQKEFFQESVFNYKLFKADHLTTEGVSKVYFTCKDHDHLVLLEDEIKKRWGNRVNVTFSLPTTLEVMDGKVSKGDALSNVAAMLGIPLEKCIAFGDGMNDLEMLQVAGKGCLMRNAHQRIKDALPEMEIIGSNDEEGVALYLKENFEL
ncbi:sugar/pyridoxal phosphate phosphatase YigL [Pantoea sp. Al-1710]|uniref:Sugar/pyridoxal phosphate phosphatase YigL n=1 Tax=Candidatus Pantoea communis TaxID=2608354 RepID=A0ABX0RSA5_9GAMM|nr:sugar/pyridoxal phosphate phosphatase YigL [Pantoea communis]NIG19338.1 sugar/pyridoxal phosphate phosphatase YigL [Pantoea communis]